MPRPGLNMRLDPGWVSSNFIVFDDDDDINLFCALIFTIVFASKVND